MNPIDAEDSTINEALQTIFPNTQESSIGLEWNGYIIELNMASQIADIYNDIVRMMQQLISDTSNFEVHWGSSSFMAQWHFELTHHNLLKIKSFWTAVNGRRTVLDQLLKTSDVIEVVKFEFISEMVKSVENSICLSHKGRIYIRNLGRFERHQCVNQQGRYISA